MMLVCPMCGRAVKVRDDSGRIATHTVLHPPQTAGHRCCASSLFPSMAYGKRDAWIMSGSTFARVLEAERAG